MTALPDHQQPRAPVSHGAPTEPAEAVPPLPKPSPVPFHSTRATHGDGAGFAEMCGLPREATDDTGQYPCRYDVLDLDEGTLARCTEERRPFPPPPLACWAALACGVFAAVMNARIF